MDLFKVYLNEQEEIRKGFCSTTSFQSLKGDVCRQFGILEATIKRVCWKDEDGDLVRIDTNEELKLMVDLQKKSSNFNQLKIYVYTGECGYIHKGIICDGCNTAPIQGNRFKCLECVDYDLCNDCFLKTVHAQHNMLLLRNDLQPFQFGSNFNLKATSSNEGDEPALTVDIWSGDASVTREQYETMGRSISKLLNEKGLDCTYSVEEDPAPTSDSMGTKMHDDNAASMQTTTVDHIRSESVNQMILREVNPENSEKQPHLPLQTPPEIQQVIPISEQVRFNLLHMNNMGFSDPDGKLTEKLVRHNGDISECLDEMFRERNDCLIVL